MVYPFLVDKDAILSYIDLKPDFTTRHQLRMLIADHCR